MTRLPTSVDELRGRRAARWIRESSRGQLDRFGPDAQRSEQDVAIARYGLVDTGIEWLVAHSGYRKDRHGDAAIASTDQWREMLAGAGRDYDVLVIGYVSRFARELRAQVNTRHALHLAGAAILFADEGVLSSDEDRWEGWAREAVESEAYSRRLGRSVSKGLASKFRQLRDQAGNAPLGFRRSPEPPHRLEVDDSTIDRAVGIFRRYALGNVSFAVLAEEEGLSEERIRKVLGNPLYNGWARRHRGAREERAETSWRSRPPVDDRLWQQVQDVRAGKRRGGGPRRQEQDLLAGILHCVCGRRIRADGMMGHGASQRRRRMHPEPCEAWGEQQSYAAETWEVPIVDQVGGLDVSEATLAKVVAVLAQPDAPISDADLARNRRRQRELAEEHLANRISDELYLVRLAELRGEAEQLRARPAGEPFPANEAVRYLVDLATAWEKAGRSDPGAQVELVRSIYARIEVTGQDFRRVDLTPAALARGLAVALPPSVAGGSRRPRQGPGPRSHIIRIPVVGRQEWLAAARERRRSA